MRVRRRRPALAWSVLIVLVLSASAHAQETDTAAHSAGGDHGQMSMDMPATSGWQFMQDGILFTEYNHQGGPRGGDEFKAPNWWMGMASRNSSHGRLTFTGMFSLDPATVGRAGYDPFALFSVLEKIDAAAGQDSGRLALLFKTHPRPSDRLNALALAAAARFDAFPGPMLEGRFYRLPSN